MCALQREGKDDQSPCALYPTDSSCVSSSSPASINARVHYVANGLGLVERAETRCTLHSRACEKYAWQISGTCTAYTPLPDRQQVRTGRRRTGDQRSEVGER